MRDYELLFVIRPDLDDSHTKTAANRVQGLITQRGGELTNTQEWGKRRLAYRIQHQGEGTYFVYRHRMEPAAAAEIEHELNLDESVLRFMMVHLDPVALEALKNPPAPMAPRAERRPMPQAVPAEGAAPTEGAPAPVAAEAAAAGGVATSAVEAAPPSAAEAAPPPAAEAPAPATGADAGSETEARVAVGDEPAGAGELAPVQPAVAPEPPGEPEIAPVAETPEGAAEGGTAESKPDATESA
jgi:small subunit ribosomal protein S6